MSGEGIHNPADVTDIQTDIDTLLARLTAARAGYLDELAAANLPTDIALIIAYVDELETRLTAVRAGYLDELAAANLPTDIANVKAVVDGIPTTAMRGTDNALLAASYTAERGTDNAMLAANGALETTLGTVDGIVDNILLDTQVRRVASGTSGIIGTAASKYIEVDTGTNAAEILAVIINGIVGFDWTLDVYVPTADAVAAPAAADKRDSIPYVNTDTEGGLLKPFALTYNAFLKFTNDSGGNQTVNDVVVVYRSRAAITIGAWT